jgi:hypothetical protein
LKNQLKLLFPTPDRGIELFLRPPKQNNQWFFPMMFPIRRTSVQKTAHCLTVRHFLGQPYLTGSLSFTKALHRKVSAVSVLGMGGLSHSCGNRAPGFFPGNLQKNMAENRNGS